MSYVRFLNNLEGSWELRDSSIQNTTPGPRGDVFWACGEFGLSTGQKIVADKKSKVCVKVKGGSVQMCGVFIFEWWLQLAGQPRCDRRQFHGEMDFLFA